MISRESWYKEADVAQLQRALEQWKRGQMELFPDGKPLALAPEVQVRGPSEQSF